MNDKEMMAAIARGEMKSIYLIAGEETYLADRIERALLGKLLPPEDREGVAVYTGDVPLEELINAIETVPFFSDRNIVIVRDTALFKEKKKEDSEKRQKEEARLIALLEDMPSYCTLILRTNEKADKRRKLYKTIAKYGDAVDVAPIRAWEVRDWLTEKLRAVDRQFDAAGSAYFIEAVSAMNTISLHFLEQEIDKLLLYTDKKIIRQTDIHEVMAGIPEVSIFAMLEAISDKNAAKALRLMESQLSAGNHPLKIITMLTRHVRQLWQAKQLAEQGVNSKKIAEELKMVPFIAEKLIQKSRKFDESVLRESLTALAEIDYRLKSGKADAADLECVVVTLCG